MQPYPDKLTVTGTLKQLHFYNFSFVFLSEGIDSEGHAANYVETEQIVQYNSAKASFVQVSQSNNAIGEMLLDIFIGHKEEMNDH